MAIDPISAVKNAQAAAAALLDALDGKAELNTTAVNSGPGHAPNWNKCGTGPNIHSSGACADPVSSDDVVASPKKTYKATLLATGAGADKRAEHLLNQQFIRAQEREQAALDAMFGVNNPHALVGQTEEQTQYEVDALLGLNAPWVQELVQATAERARRETTPQSDGV